MLEQNDWQHHDCISKKNQRRVRKNLMKHIIRTLIDLIVAIKIVQQKEHDISNYAICGW